MAFQLKLGRNLARVEKKNATHSLDTKRSDLVDYCVLDLMFRVPSNGQCVTMSTVNAMHV
jgi:hypothetical protein